MRKIAQQMLWTNDSGPKPADSPPASNSAKSANTASAATDILAGLNERQRQAVEECDRPVLVIAGPGTGKTRVITEKVQYLVQAKKIAPDRILALTFTEKAAGEMAERIRHRLTASGVRRQPAIHTFHGFCFQLVEEYGHRLDFGGSLRLLVGPLYVQFVLDQIDHLATDNTDLLHKSIKFAQRLADFMSRCHDEGLIYVDLVTQADQWLEGLDKQDQKSARAVRDLAASLPTLLKRQYAEQIVTYGDLLTLAYRLLREDDSVRREVQGRYDYVLVDELQDNNTTQFEIVNLIAREHGKILVVGDEDQCIYRFRGAGLALLDEFKKHWTEAREKLRVVPLEENYRSTAAILDVCQTLIAKNTGRTANKTLRVANGREPKGSPKVTLTRLETLEAEHTYVVQDVLRRLAEGRTPADVAILCRSLNNVPHLITLLRAAGIHVEVVGEAGMMRNACVREVVAWLRALAKPDEEETSLHKVLRFPNMRLTHADVVALGQAARKAQTPMMVLIESLRDQKVEIVGLSPHGHARLREFVSLYHEFRQDTEATTRIDVVGLIEEILRFTGLRGRLTAESPRGRQDAGALASLCQLAATYEAQYPWPSLQGFLRHLDLLLELNYDEKVATPSDDPTTVKVMTVHQSKGREFPIVYVTGIADRFPSTNQREWYRKFLDHLTLGDLDVKLVHLEEERRVLYVALSRAQEELILSYYDKKNDVPIKNVSPFVAELQEATLLEERTIATASLPVTPVDLRLRTREAIETRLHHLVSRLGLRLEGADVANTLQEALSLLGGLIAHGQADGERLVHEALASLGIPAEWKIQIPDPEPMPGVTSALTLSATTLEMYEECPRRYFFKQVVRIPERTHSAARLGVAIHTTLEHFHRRHAKAKPEHWPELLTLFQEEVGEVNFLNEKEKQQGLERGERLLRQYLTEECARSDDIVRVAVEQEFTIELAHDVTLRGAIDRMDELADGRIRIVDYKSGKVKSRPGYLSGYQMPAYALAVQSFFGKELAAVEVIGLGKLKELANGEVLERWELPWNTADSYALTPQRLDEVRASIDEIIAKIRAGKFDAQPSEETCRWCSYQLLCEHAHGTQE